MPRENFVDGERFVRASDGGEIKIVVMDRGFVYVGRYLEEEGGIININGARSLIRWGTDQHLGQLVNGPLEDTKLGAACTVRARLSQVIYTIEVSHDAWMHHIA